MVKFDSTGSKFWRDLEVLEDIIAEAYDAGTKKDVKSALKRAYGQISTILAKVDTPGYEYFERVNE